MKTRGWSAEVGIGLGTWLALMVAGRDRMFRDPGTFWHTVIGRRILTGGFIDADPFSFTFAGRPWVPYQWLGECAMAVVHDLAGLDGLLLVTVTALSALYGWMAHRLLRGGLTWAPTTMLVVLGVASSAGHFLVRPLIATIFGLGLTCAWLGDVESGRRSPARLWWLLPIFWVWANTHGGVLGGIASLGFVVGAWCLARLVGRDSPATGPGRAAGLGALVVACTLVPLANPYGVRLPLTWLDIVGSPALPRLIVEHGPLRPGDPVAVTVGIFAAIYAIALGGVPFRRWRASWLLAPLWLALTVSRVRNAPLFGVVGLAALADILPHSRVGAWLARPGRELLRPTPEGAGRGIGRSWVWPVALVAVALGLQVAGARVPVLGRGWARLDPKIWPVDLLTELGEAAARGKHPHFFNDYPLGAFLIYHAPGARVFVDDRCELYGDEWLTRFDRAERDPVELWRWLSAYRIDYALVRTGSGFDRAFGARDGWSIVRRVDAATLYRKTAGSIARSPARHRPPAR